MNTKTRWIVLWAALFSAPLLLSTCGGDASDEEAAQVEQFTSQCETLVEAYCKKAVACDPVIAATAWDAQNEADCRAAAIEECKPDTGDTEPDDTDADSCEITLPSDALVAECVDALEDASCDEAEAVLQEGACAEIDEMMDCEAGGGDGDTDTDTDADTDSDTDTDTDGDTDTDADGDTDTDADGDADADTDGDTAVEINFEGCVAAVAATCSVAQACADSLSSGAGRLEEALAECDQSIAANEEEIAAACEAYLTDEVVAGNNQAVYLNEASAEEIADCASGDNCNAASVTSLLGGLSAFLSSGDPSDLAAVTGAVLGNCPVP